MGPGAPPHQEPETVRRPAGEETLSRRAQVTVPGIPLRDLPHHQPGPPPTSSSVTQPPNQFNSSLSTSRGRQHHRAGLWGGLPSTWASQHLQVGPMGIDTHKRHLGTQEGPPEQPSRVLPTLCYRQPPPQAYSRTPPHPQAPRPAPKSPGPESPAGPSPWARPAGGSDGRGADSPGLSPRGFLRSRCCPPAPALDGCWT